MAKDEATMERIALQVLVKSIYASEEDLSKAAVLISERLIDAGFTRVDPHMIDFFKQLSIETRDFAKSIRSIKSEIELFGRPTEKVEAILRLIDCQEEKLTKKFERGTQDREKCSDEKVSEDEIEQIGGPN